MAPTLWQIISVFAVGVILFVFSDRDLTEDPGIWIVGFSGFMTLWAIIAWALQIFRIIPG